MTADDELLHRIERYYDGVPRRRSNVEQIGPFTLFVATSGWPYYARPALDGAGTPNVGDVRAVLSRQAEIGVPRAIEWVHEITPNLAEAVESASVDVHRCPLMVLDGAPRGNPGTARMLTAADEADLRKTRAAVGVAFGHAGTATGEAGIEAREAALSKAPDAFDQSVIERMAAGELRQGAVWATGDEEAGPVGGGGYAPLDGVAELAGIGVLPAFRRRGLAGMLTCLLARDALDRGATTVFCSADTDDVARVYAGIGFRRIATACIATAP